MYYQDWFGDQDATRDKNLFHCFTEIPVHKDAIEPNYTAIRAFKGSGKTALLRQLIHCTTNPTNCNDSCPLSWKLCEVETKYFIVPVNVTQISFEKLCTLANSKSDPRPEIAMFLSAILKAYLVLSIYENINTQLTPPPELVKKIHRLMKVDKISFSTANAIGELLSLVERSLTQTDSSHFSTAIEKLIFKEEKSLSAAYEICIEILKACNKTALIILDQFDDILDLFLRRAGDKLLFHNIVANSLLKLAYGEEDTIRCGFPCEQAQIKILFPEDLYSMLTARDMEKYDQHSIPMKWSHDSLKSFLGKRIATFLDINLKNDTDTSIYTIFNKSIYNTFYKHHEDIFEYLLRHTLFKPRDFQQICTCIAGEWINTKKIESKEHFIRTLPISSKAIKEGVKKGTIALVKYLRNEFKSIDLNGILNSLHRKPNIMSYSDMYNHLTKLNLDAEHIPTAELINNLARIGIIGKFIEGDQKISETYRMNRINKIDNNFYVSLFNYSTELELEFDFDDQVVISPIFYDALDTLVDYKRPITPL